MFFLYASHRRKPRVPDISMTFVFPEEKPHLLEDNTTQYKPTSALYAKDEDIYFANFIGDNNSSIKRPLPAPRSHMTLSSSEMIRLFARDIGCTRAGKKHGLIYQYLKIMVICFDKNRELFCNKWIWDPANWTLILSRKEERFNIRGPYRICAFPRATERVEKVVYPNGTEDLPGCTIDKSPCSIKEPYFDRVLNMRINWSPCCRRIMLDMLSAAHDIFEYHNVRYVLVGGAVISVARENGKLIPYDTDLDLIIDKRDRAKFNNQTAKDMATLGYYYEYRHHGSYVRICANQVCDAHIDVWFYEKDPRDKHTIKYYKMWFWTIREEYLFPTTWILFEGKKYRFPRKILKYLNHEYLSGIMAGYHNWNQVLLCNFKRGRKCTFYS